MPSLDEAASGFRSATDDELHLRLADVLEEYVAGIEQGNAPTAEQLIAQHPDLADLLPAYLDGIDWIHNAMGATFRPCHDSDSDAEPDALPSEIDSHCSQRQRIGDFEMLREIGRGGMGVVYEAVQLSLNRRVALKVLPFAAVLDERQIARFRTEAQAAAGLHHTNIVPVYAVGQERGVHFYAMQYIEGRSLAQAIEEIKRADRREAEPTRAVAPNDTTISLNVNALSTARSHRESDYFRMVARLGTQAAQALDHAHQLGVVHRDVKPSNLIVDSQGKLWVTDFGLARVQSEMSVTLPGDIVGTLRYMSPEQAIGRGDLVDGRSDVYALGATLYELITLSPAHPGNDHHTLLERINNADPTPLRKLNNAAPVDLETIVLRAMERNREDRYLTAAELADDLQRFLDGKATLARRPNLLERATRWIARRRKAAAVVGMAMTFLTAFSMVCAVWVSTANQRTKQALAESQESLRQAEEHYEQARGVVDHFGGKVADRLADLPGAESLRRDLLLDTLGYYQHFANSTTADSRLSADLAATHFKSAAIAERLGDRTAATSSYRMAVDEWRVRASESTTEESQASLALGLASLARVVASGDDFQQADRLFAEAIALQRNLQEAAPDDATRATALAETLCNCGLVCRRNGNKERAVALMLQGVALYEHALSQTPDSAQQLRHLAVAQNNLSDTYGAESLDEALAASQAAQATMRRLAKLRPTSPLYLADLAMTNNNRAALESAAGNWPAAADHYRKAAGQIGQLAASNPLIPRHRRELAIAQSNLALALAKVGEWDESQAAFDAAEAVLTKLAADFPQESIYASSLAALWNNRGVALRSAGQNEAAVEAFANAVAQQEAVVASGQPSPLEIGLLCRQYENYAAVLRDVNRRTEAEATERKLQEFLTASQQSSNR